MDIDTYQSLALRTSKFPGGNGDFPYVVFGVLGEIGEAISCVLDAVHKDLIKMRGTHTPEYLSEIRFVQQILWKIELRKKEMRTKAVQCSSVLNGDGVERSHEIEKFKKDLMLEIGDIFWYLAALSSSFGINLSDALEENINKLAKRHNVLV